MKKMFGISALLIMLTVTGCGKGESLTCTMTEDGNKAEIVAEFKNDKISKAVQTMIFEDEEEAKMTYAFMSMVDSDDYTVKISGKKVTVSMTGDTLDEIIEWPTSKAEFKKAAEADGFTCK